MARSIQLSRSATSGSWRTSTRARRRPPSGSSTTPARPTRWARSTRAPPSWTGWSRSRSGASPSPPPPPPAWKATPSTSSTRRATSTSPSRWSGRCGCSTAPSPCSTPWPVSNRSPRPYGVRPTATGCPASASSTRWTGSGPTSSRPSSRSRTGSAATRLPSRFRSAAESDFNGVIDLVEMKAIVWPDDDGEEWETVDIPAEYVDAGARVARTRCSTSSPPRTRSCSRSTSRTPISSPDEIRQVDPQGHPRPATSSRSCCGSALQEQGRPAAARRRRRATCPARSTCRRCEGFKPGDEDETMLAQGRATTSRSRAWPSRS